MDPIRRGFIHECMDMISQRWRRVSLGNKIAAISTIAIPGIYLWRERIKARDKRQYYAASIGDLVYMDFAIGKKYIGRVLIGLYNRGVPMSCENFLQLCQGFHIKDKVIGYRNSKIHRIQQGVAMIGGLGITGEDQATGISIYGSKFPDENYDYEFIQDGDVALLSMGPHSNTSQFMITFCPLPVLHRQHVVIGTVLKGMKVIRQIEDVGTKNGSPIEDVWIINCGVYRGSEDGPPYFTHPELFKDADLDKESFKQLTPESQKKMISALT